MQRLTMYINISETSSDQELFNWPYLKHKATVHCNFFNRHFWSATNPRMLPYSARRHVLLPPRYFSLAHTYSHDARLAFVLFQRLTHDIHNRGILRSLRTEFNWSYYTQPTNYIRMSTAVYVSVSVQPKGTKGKRVERKEQKKNTKL